MSFIRNKTEQRILGGFSTGDAGGISDFINAIDNQQTGLQGMNKPPEEILDIQIAGPAKAVKTVNAVVDEWIVCDSCPKDAAKTRKIPGT